MTSAWALFCRDVRLYWRRPSDVLVVAVFFLVAVCLFPFGVGIAPALLNDLAVGVIWVVALLAGLLSLGQIFAQDQADGSLDLMLLSPTPLPLLVTAKIWAHFVTSGMVITLMAPILGFMMGLAPTVFLPLMGSLILGGLCLSYVGAFGAALMLPAQGHTGGGTSGALLVLIVSPLLIPVLIFAVGAVEAARHGLDGGSAWMALVALGLAALGGIPWAIAACLRL
ncbi:MAG: heme exporter protein CcmB [Candidatus Symbiobacter sp.]|nr:heme exporter protein CcmB [Candidatus Symbiobacter sp.]